MIRPLRILILLLPMAAAGQTPGVTAWAYQLQEIQIPEIVANPTFDLVVIDYSADGGESGEWSPEEIALIRDSGKIPVAYISVGEAEDYRFYWDPSWWDAPPPWLGAENPDWPGNYKVRFWDPEWQAIVFAWIGRILEQGFDGLYLDVVDAYYYWSEENPENPQADADMARFLLAIRDTVDAWGRPDLLLIPQNGEFLPVEDDVAGPLAEAYYGAIQAIGVEDVFFPGPLDENNPFAPDAERIAMLAAYRERGKTVFSVEYLTDPDLVAQYVAAAAAEGYIPYATVRALDTLYDGIPTAAVPDPPPAGGFLAGPPRPNPARGAFRLPVYSPGGSEGLVLEVVDAQGRLLSRRPLVLRPGWNELCWRAPGRVRSGILFWRLRGTHLRGRVVLLGTGSGR
jgi:cysteinyl-tRNA synthetase